MGLDMYAYAAPKNAVSRSVNFTLRGIEPLEQLHVWRKHPNLHGWMEERYYAKGGYADCFNCEPMVLTLEDLDALEGAICGRTLPVTRGFFFGESDGSERDDDLAFIAKARIAITAGKVVIYDSWW